MGTGLVLVKAEKTREGADGRRGLTEHVHAGEPETFPPPPPTPGTCTFGVKDKVTLGGPDQGVGSNTVVTPKPLEKHPGGERGWKASHRRVKCHL